MLKYLLSIYERSHDSPWGLSARVLGLRKRSWEVLCLRGVPRGGDLGDLALPPEPRWEQVPGVGGCRCFPPDLAAGSALRKQDHFRSTAHLWMCLKRSAAWSDLELQECARVRA